MSRLLYALLAVVPLLVFAACDGGGDPARYPGPLDLPEASLSDLGQPGAPLPGRYNVTATVAKRTSCYCPEDAVCGPCPYPNGLLVSRTGDESTDPYAEPVLHIAAEGADQFVAGRRYVFSVEVEDARFPPDAPLYRSALLGYGHAD